MNKELWKQVEMYFHQALNLTAKERVNFLKKLEKSHKDLAPDLQSLLNSHFKAGAFLEDTVFEITTKEMGEQIGPWEIIKEIGRGGMSIVYLAERDDGSFSRKVAIKFIHGIVPGKKLHYRLKNEQNILASLNHENISGLFDAGIDKNGRPYFIMEYIDGLQIDKWCIEKRLSVHDRLKLFVQVCEAVSYAHQRLIVHRDIKPSNILVDKKGTVKLLDFGIAKMLDDQGLDSHNTQTGMYLMTPEFASPEQINNEIITTASDVYSLGQLLYLLLTRKHPFDVKQKSPLELSKIINDQEPNKASKAVLATDINSDNIPNDIYGDKTLQQVSKQLRGDLDNIIAKALRKDPERRYKSAEDFLSDIQNYFHNKPVSARPETPLYRTKKFIKRNKTVVVSACLVALLLIGATIFSIRQAHYAQDQQAIAQKRFDDLRKLANSLIFDLHDAVLNLPGSTSAREMIVSEALTYLDQLASTENSDSQLKIELANAYQKIGNVQGNPFNPNLGKHEDALKSYEAGIQLIQSIGSNDPHYKNARMELANIHDWQADIYMALDSLDEAKKSKELSLAIYENIREEFPDDIEISRSYATVLLKYGDLMGNPNFRNLIDTDQSLELYQMAENILLDVYHSDPDLPSNLKSMGLIYERMGTIYNHINQLEEAEWKFNKSLKYRTRMVELEPDNADFLRDKAIAHEKLGHIYKKQEDLEKAIIFYEQSFQVFSWLAEMDSQNTNALQSLAISHIHLGDIFSHPEQNIFYDTSSSIKHFEASRKILTEIIESGLSNARTEFLIDLTDRRMNAIRENF